MIDTPVIDDEEFKAELHRLKALRWARILNSEPPGRPPGRRPRDPEQERILARRDRARVLQRERAAQPGSAPPQDAP